eukprot:4056756-Prymnesium_polylepis.1
MHSLHSSLPLEALVARSLACLLPRVFERGTASAALPTPPPQSFGWRSATSLSGRKSSWSVCRAAAKP